MSLLEMRISGLAVLDRVSVDAAPGFNVLTGETGSGKSVCISALHLVLGGRVEGNPIRPGSERAVLTAVLDEVPSDLGERLGSIGVPVDEYLTLHRELARGGRGQCRINGALVSLAVLRECGERMVEITGQGESQRLLRPSRQRSLLDAFGGPGLAGLREVAGAAVAAWRDGEARLAGAKAAREHSAAELTRARQLVEDLEPLALTAGEDTDLEAECGRLRHAAALAAAAAALGNACSHGEDDGPGHPGAADQLAGAVDAAGPVAGVASELDALINDAESAVSNLREIGLQARRLATELVVDDARLAVVEERLDVIDRVRRRHGGTLVAALEELGAAKIQITEAEAGSRIEAIDAEVAALRNVAAVRCAALSERRTRVAVELEAAVIAGLRALCLPHARFRAVVRQNDAAAGVDFGGRRVACTVEGIDEVEFRFAANRDGVPLPLGQGASGGELSRLTLALRAVVADNDDCPTLVLDEIDTGVGGETAARIGELLAGIGGARQVLAVTHRAEIAARATSHLVVTKREAARGATAEVAAVDGGDRVREVARMLSGRGTPAALARAAELLDEGSHLEVSAPRTIAPR